MAKTSNADRQRYWRKVIERQRTSGQSIVGACSEKGLPAIPLTDTAALEALLPNR